jgi:hypothetical protein
MSHSIKRKTSKRRSPSKKRSSQKNSRRSVQKSIRRRSPTLKKKSPKKGSKKRSVGGYQWMDTSKFKKNSLGKYGYKTSLNVTQRHTALEKAIKAYGAHSVWSKLNAVSILNKNRSPKTANVFTSDKNWVKRTHLH